VVFACSTAWRYEAALFMVPRVVMIVLASDCWAAGGMEPGFMDNRACAA